jgi:phytoene dehydrogenase-like protein
MAQPTVADPSRAPAGQHVAWAYIHVPRGSTVDMTGPIEAQIERFAPGFRTKVIQRRAWGPADLERMNPNLIGGDIAGGAMSGTQFLLRPTLRPNPYATPDPLVYICSSSTPPGGGVHGMSGFYAAESALHRHRL